MIFLLEEGKYATPGRMKDDTDSLQGKWHFLTNEGTSDYDPRFEVVDGATDGQKAVNVLAPITKPPIQKDQGDDEYETIYSETSSSWDYKFPAFVRESGVLIEDTKLSDRVLADFTTATPGEAMVLTVSGFPTLDGASDDPGSSQTIVAYFEEYTGGSVLYRTV